MDVTNRFVLDFARQFAAAHPQARILDYGCGSGEVVIAGHDAGLDIYGTDIFYSGARSRTEAERSPLFGARILPMEPDRTPFPDAHFDLIANNQVLEHVEDLDGTLRELHRLLKPGGLLLSIFPSRDVFREGHIGIPFAHWFPQGSRLRFYYAWALRALGFGYHKQESPTRRQWAADKLRWIDTYTRYRSRREIFQAFGRYFVTETRELDYIRYRMKATPRLSRLVWVAGLPIVSQAGVALFRKLAFWVLLSRKKAP